MHYIDVHPKADKASLICHTEPNKNSNEENLNKLECGPMPNVMVVLPNIGGALCSTPQTLADAHY